MRKLGMLSALFLLISCGTGQASVLLGGLDWNFDGVNTLTLTDAVPTGNQVKNLPCIICGDHQPLQPTGFGYNDFGNTGNQSNLLFFSSGIVNDTNLGSDTLSVTNYSGAFLAAFLEAAGDVNLTFSIGIDVNDAAGKPRQTLESFFFLDVTTQTVLAAFINSTEGNLVAVNQGTGYPDMTLGSFSLFGLDLTHEYAFFARISGATDGPDSFFLIAQVEPPPEVPLPAAVWLFGGVLGVAGMVAGHRRRKSRSVWDEQKA